MFRSFSLLQIGWLGWLALSLGGCSARLTQTRTSSKVATSHKTKTKAVSQNAPSSVQHKKAIVQASVATEPKAQTSAPKPRKVLPVKLLTKIVAARNIQDVRTALPAKVHSTTSKLAKVAKYKGPMFPDVKVPHDVKPMPWFLRKYRTKRWGFTWIVLKRFSRYKHILEPIFRRHRMPLALMMLAGNESSFVPRLRSKKTAMGMWQIMAHTGRRFGLKITPWVDERRHVEKATDAMLRYMKFLYKRFRSWPLVIAAYNCGEGCVDRIIKRCPKMTFWQMRRHAKCWVPRETRMAVPRFFTLVHYWRNPKKLHHYPKPFPPLRWKVVRTPGAVALRTVADVTGLSLKELRLFNPALSTWATPPGQRYPLRVPAASARRLRRFFRNKRKPLSLLTLRVKSSHRLQSLAKRYKVPRSVLMQLNRVWTDAQLRKLRYVLVPRSQASKSWRRKRTYWKLGLHVRQFRRRLPPSWLFQHWPGRLRNRRRLRRACYKAKRKTSLRALSQRLKLKFSPRQLKRWNPKLKRIHKGSWVRLSGYARCPYRRRKKNNNDIG